MSERVLMNSSLIKISAPGYDASTASFEKLLLDSTSGGRSISGYMIGSASWTAFDFGGGGGQVTVYFPSMGYIPIVFWQANYSGKSIGQGYWDAMPDGTQEQMEGHGGSIQILTDRFTFFSASYAPGVLRYMVCHAQI